MKAKNTGKLRKLCAKLSVPNSVPRHLDRESGRPMSRSESRPPVRSSSPERHDFNFTFNTAPWDATSPGFGPAQCGIPLSPLHDV